jgi:hypothetical protein
MDDLRVHCGVGGQITPRDFRRHGGVIAARLNASPILVSNLPSDSIQFVDKAIRAWFSQSNNWGSSHGNRTSGA